MDSETQSAITKYLQASDAEEREAYFEMTRKLQHLRLKVQREVVA